MRVGMASRARVPATSGVLPGTHLAESPMIAAHDDVEWNPANGSTTPDVAAASRASRVHQRADIAISQDGWSLSAMGGRKALMMNWLAIHPL